MSTEEKLHLLEKAVVTECWACTQCGHGEPCEDWLEHGKCKCPDIHEITCKKAGYEC